MFSYHVITLIILKKYSRLVKRTAGDYVFLLQDFQEEK